MISPFNVDLSKLDGYNILVYLFTILALTLPGFGYVYLQTPYFLSISFSKVLLLSIFFSVPAFTIYMLAVLSDMDFSKKEDPRKGLLLATSYITIGYYFLSLAFYYLISLFIEINLLSWIYIVPTVALILVLINNKLKKHFNP